MRNIGWAAVLTGLNLAAWATFFLPDKSPFRPDPTTLAIFGILFALLTLASLVAAVGGAEAAERGQARETMTVIAVAGALLAFGVVFGKVEPIPAALLLIFGSAALLVAVAVAATLKEKVGLEITSHWGGLGGGVGGWRVSPAVTGVLLALVFIGAAVAAAGLDGGDSGANKHSDSPPADNTTAPATNTTKEADSADAGTGSNVQDNAAVGREAGGRDSNTQTTANQTDAASSVNGATPEGVGEAPSRTRVDRPEDG